jgi:Uma2 family endonuclease
MTVAHKLFTLEDFLRIENPEGAELIDGRIVYKTMSGGAHASKNTTVAHLIFQNFRRPKSKDGRGGWWIQQDVSVYFPKLERVLAPDIVGWRREIYPTEPKSYPVHDIPNWVCEICHSTHKKDTTTVPETLAAHGVEYYWLVYVESENLQIFQLKDKHYSLIGSYFREDILEHLPPFDSVELNVGVLLGNDPVD